MEIDRYLLFGGEECDEPGGARHVVTSFPDYEEAAKTLSKLNNEGLYDWLHIFDVGTLEIILEV